MLLFQDVLPIPPTFLLHYKCMYTNLCRLTGIIPIFQRNNHSSFFLPGLRRYNWMLVSEKVPFSSHWKQDSLNKALHYYWLAHKKVWLIPRNVIQEIVSPLKWATSAASKQIYITDPMVGFLTNDSSSVSSVESDSTNTSWEIFTETSQATLVIIPRSHNFDHHNKYEHIQTGTSFHNPHNISWTNWRIYFSDCKMIFITLAYICQNLYFNLL